MQVERSKNKGITLIALVITIIVLLILAGVSIATLTGQNGILTRATDAKEVTNKEGAREKLNLILADLHAKKIPKGLSLTLNDALAGEIAEYDEVTSANFTGNVIEVVIDGYTFEVNGDLGIENGIEKVEPDNLDDWEYTVGEDGYATLTCYKGDDTTVIIPNYINGYWVKTIGTNKKDLSFSINSLWGIEICELIERYDSHDCYVQRTIKEIIISEGIEKIERCAFMYTENLEKVEIPRSVTDIGNEAFASTSYMRNVFQKENKLKSINIYKEVENMGNYVFGQRSDLVINVEKDISEIPETWQSKWNAININEYLETKYNVSME